jgi:hypothetical protein
MTLPIEQETLFAELDQLLEPEIEARLRRWSARKLRKPIRQR